MLLSVRAAAQGAPGGQFPNFRLRPAENGRSPLNHAAAARSPCTKPYNRPKIMQIYSFFAPAPRCRPLPHRYPIPAPATPCRTRAFPRRDRPNSAAALPNRYPETPPRLARQGKSIFLRGYDIHQIARFQAFFGKNRYQISKFFNFWQGFGFCRLPREGRDFAENRLRKDGNL